MGLLVVSALVLDGSVVAYAISSDVERILGSNADRRPECLNIPLDTFLLHRKCHRACRLSEMSLRRDRLVGLVRRVECCKGREGDCVKRRIRGVDRSSHKARSSLQKNERSANRHAWKGRTEHPRLLYLTSSLILPS